MSVASRAIFSNFFEEQSTQNHPKYLSGLSRALFPTTFLEIAVYISYIPGFLAYVAFSSCLCCGEYQFFFPRGARGHAVVMGNDPFSDLPFFW